MHTIILSHLLEGRKAEKENREKKISVPRCRVFSQGKNPKGETCCVSDPFRDDQSQVL